VRGFFVTGTDTGVGKSVLSAALLAAMSNEGVDVRAFKPVLAGLDRSDRWGRDDELLASACGMDVRDVTGRCFRDAASPHFAAELCGESVDPEELIVAAVRMAGPRAPGRVLVVEGAGGLLVPLAGAYTMAHLARDLSLPLLIAARPGLGTINHTLLTVRVAETMGIRVGGIVFTRWPRSPSALEESNRSTVEQLAGVTVVTFPVVEGPARGLLAAAGDALPWRDWLDSGTCGTAAGD
jgi:dethiobiotin synthetase